MEELAGYYRLGPDSRNYKSDGMVSARCCKGCFKVSARAEAHTTLLLSVILA